jgi:nitrogen-specific signal transduction histidine kinase
VLDAAGDAVLVYGLDGRLLRTNRRARERLTASIGGVPATLAEFSERAMPRRADGEPLTHEHLARALRGEVTEAELTLTGPGGTTRRVHVSFGPVLEDDEVRAVVVASRDITLLHDAIAGRARFEGAMAAARTIAHELNNRLQKLSSYAELLPAMDPAESATMLEEMVEDVASMGATINQLQRIVRFEGTDTPVGTALDIEAATRPS